MHPAVVVSVSLSSRMPWQTCSGFVNEELGVRLTNELAASREEEEINTHFSNAGVFEWA